MSYHATISYSFAKKRLDTFTFYQNNVLTSVIQKRSLVQFERTMVNHVIKNIFPI